MLMNTRKIKELLRSDRAHTVAILTSLFLLVFAFLWFAPVASAAETLIKSNNVGSTATSASANGSGLMYVGGVTWDSSGGAYGITKIVVRLRSAASGTANMFLAQGTSGTPTNIVYAAETPTLTSSFADYTYTFTPTYSADDTLFVGVVCSSSDCRWAANNASEVWGSAANIGIGGNTYQVAYIDIYGDPDALTPPDPRPDPVTTIVAPTATAYGISGVPYRFASNVCLDDYAGEEPYVRWQIQKDDGGWTDFASGSSEHFGFYVANGCDTGLAYGWGGIPNPILSASFTTGDYRIRASSFFTGDISDDDDWGAWTSYVEFSYESSAYGGGGGGSWGGGTADSGDGSAEDWASFFDGVDSHDDLYGACKLLGLDFNFLGTGESEAGTGDGLPCLWTWVRYALIPPADATFNFVKRPFDALVTRWPLTYITSPWQALTGALTEGGECPFPDFFEGSSGMFGALPIVEPCTWLDPIATLIDDNAFVSAALVMFLWCAVVALLIDDAFKFFEA